VNIFEYEKRRKYSFTYHVHETGSVPAARRDRWTEGEVIFGNSRCRELDVTVLVFMRRNNILEHLALRNALPSGNLQLARGCLVLLTRVAFSFFSLSLSLSL
jgi:hypothetical protein